MSFDNKKEVISGNGCLGVGQEANFLQVRDGMCFPGNKVPYNAMLQPIFFTSKSLTFSEIHYSNMEREALVYYMA